MWSAWSIRYIVATIDRHLSSIGYYHKQVRHPLPTKDPEVERIMRGIRRAKGIAPNGDISWHNMRLRRYMARPEARALLELPGMAKDWCSHEANPVDRNVWNWQINHYQ